MSDSFAVMPEAVPADKPEEVKKGNWLHFKVGDAPAVGDSAVPVAEAAGVAGAPEVEFVPLGETKDYGPDLVSPPPFKSGEEFRETRRQLFKDIWSFKNKRGPVSGYAPSEEGAKRSLIRRFLGLKLNRPQEEIDDYAVFYEQQFVRDHKWERGAFLDRAAEDLKEEITLDGFSEVTVARARKAAQRRVGLIPALKGFQEMWRDPDALDKLPPSFQYGDVNGGAGPTREVLREGPSSEMDQKLNHLFVHTYGQVERELAPHWGLINQTQTALDGLMESENMKENATALAAATGQLVKMKEEERELVFQALEYGAQEMGKANLAGKSGRLGWTQQVMESVGREFYPAGTNARVAEEALQLIPRKGKVMWRHGRIDSPEAARRYVREYFDLNQGNIKRDDDPQTVNPFGIFTAEMGGEEMVLTPEEEKLIDDVWSPMSDQLMIMRRLASLGAVVDPVDELPSSVGSLVGGAAFAYVTQGRGLPYMWKNYVDKEYESIRLKDPKIMPSDVREMALVVGTIKAGLDEIPVPFLKKVPGIAELRQGDFLMTAVRNGVASATTDKLKSTVQDYTQPAVQSVMSALSKDVPGYDWSKEKPFLSQSAEGLAVSLPILLVKAGLASVSDYRQSRSLARMDDEIGSLGYLPADRAQILAAMQAGDGAMAGRLMDQLSGSRSPAVAAEFQTRVLQHEQQRAERMEGADVRMVRHNGGYVVITPNDIVTFSSHAEANQVVDAHLQAHDARVSMEGQAAAQMERERRAGLSQAEVYVPGDAAASGPLPGRVPVGEELRLSTNRDGSPMTEVQMAARQAEREVRLSHPGLVGQRVHVFANVEDLLASDYARGNPLSEAVLAPLREGGSNGFYNKETHEQVILTDRLPLRKDESLSQAATRAILGARVDASGFRALNESNVEFRKVWAAWSKEIGKDELARVREKVGHPATSSANDPVLSFEWMAERLEQMNQPGAGKAAHQGFRLPEKGSLERKMWDHFQSAVVDFQLDGNLRTGMGNDLISQTRSMINRMREAHRKNLFAPPGAGSAGSVIHTDARASQMMSMPEGKSSLGSESDGSVPVNQNDGASMTPKAGMEPRDLNRPVEERIPYLIEGLGLTAAAALSAMETGKDESVNAISIVSTRESEDRLLKPAKRPDRTMKEINQAITEATGESSRIYPQKAEEAIANLRAAGRDLTEGEAEMIFSQYNQKYPGWNQIEKVSPTKDNLAAQRPVINDKAFVPNVREVPAPATRVDNPFDRLQREVAETAVRKNQKYPRTAEQAMANLWADGKDVTDGEAQMVYSMFHQKYPGWSNMITVEPTGEMEFKKRENSEVIMRAAKPFELLEAANAEFNKALKEYLWAPERWAKAQYLGLNTKPLVFDENHPWTKVIKENNEYNKMRTEFIGKVQKEAETGTVSSLIGWRPSKNMRALRWDDQADGYPIVQPVYDLFIYATGLDLKSTGSVKGDMVITKVNRGNRTFTVDVTLTDELRSGSMTRIPGWVPGIGNYEFIKDNTMGPLFYTLPLKWQWTETLNY